jgi:hypothetical protein
MADSSDREWLPWCGSAPIVPIVSRPSGQQSSELDRRNHRTSLSADDCFLWVPLEGALLRARQKGLRTFLISFIIVVFYYGILVVWFWNSFPNISA